MLPRTHPAIHSLDLDTVNQATWKLPATVRACEKRQGWTDPGERAAIAQVAREVRSRPLLDIGVGAGRSSALLKTLSQDYTGIDQTPEMVRACRRRHPELFIEQMDARNLGAFQEAQFALAVFSGLGIDTMNHADRLRVLREVHRVLQPGGLFILSARNRDGPERGQRPGLRLDWSWNPFRLGWEGLKQARTLLPAWRNHRRYRALNQIHEDWAVANCAAHGFGLVVMHTTLAEQNRQLDAAGFKVEQVLDNVNGRPVTTEVAARGAAWFHYLARKA